MEEVVMEVFCCVCKRRIGEKRFFRERLDAGSRVYTGDGGSHGFCQSCYDKMMGEIDGSEEGEREGDEVLCVQV